MMKARSLLFVFTSALFVGSGAAYGVSESLVSELSKRYRDTETGTFLTPDPLGFVDGPNRYAYVTQNPWTKFDPTGLKYEYTYQEVNDDDSDKVRREKQTYNNKLDHIKSQHDKVGGSKYYEGSVVQQIDNDDKNIVRVKVASGKEGSRHGYGKGDTSMNGDGSLTTTIYVNPTRSARYETENGQAEASTAEKFVHESTHALDLINAFPDNAERYGSWMSRGSLTGDDFVKYPSMLEKRAVDETNLYRNAVGLDQRTSYADSITVDFLTMQRDPNQQERMRAMGRWNSAAKAKEAQGYQMGIVSDGIDQRVEWRKKLP
ncbi:MAG: RHS repeat-associated core domain-containing protein [Coraliomargarita sp.]